MVWAWLSNPLIIIHHLKLVRETCTRFGENEKLKKISNIKVTNGQWIDLQINELV